jgi:hypothetical protein
MILLDTDSETFIDRAAEAIVLRVLRGETFSTASFHVQATSELPQWAWRDANTQALNELNLLRHVAA